jgi:hypothetical protein
MQTLSKEELRSLVCEWTLTLKEEGFPPEKALVTVKTLVREAVLPHVSEYDRSALADDRTALVVDASQYCIDAYFNEAAARLARASTMPGRNAIARNSLSRKLLLRFLVIQPEQPILRLASRLSLDIRELAAFASGMVLIPIEVQERLAALVIAQEPRLAPLARRLRLQLEATRRYQDGEVVRHMTSPPKMW